MNIMFSNMMLEILLTKKQKKERKKKSSVANRGAISLMGVRKGAQSIMGLLVLGRGQLA